MGYGKHQTYMSTQDRIATFIRAQEFVTIADLKNFFKNMDQSAIKHALQQLKEQNKIKLGWKLF